MMLRIRTMDAMANVAAIWLSLSDSVRCGVAHRLRSQICSCYRHRGCWTVRLRNLRI